MAHAAPYMTRISAARRPAADKPSLIADLKARYSRYRMYRTTLSELSALSNHELSDLGMHRSQVRAVAWSVAYEQVSDLVR